MPAAANGFEITTLDLSRNPRLVLVGPGGLENLDALDRVILPAGLASITPAVLRELLKKRKREEQAPPRDQRAGRRRQQSHDRYRAPCFARTRRSSAPASEQWMDAGRLQKRIFQR